MLSIISLSIRKHFDEADVFISLAKIQPWICLIQTKTDMQIWIFRHNFVLPNHHDITGFKGQTFFFFFYNFKKGQQCNYCIAVNDKQKLLLPRSMSLNEERRSLLNCSHSNLQWAAATEKWSFFHLGMVFDTLLSESKADSVDICIHINNKTVQYKYKDSVCVYVCVNSVWV